MAAGTYTALSLDVLEPVSKSYHITYSKRAFCVSPEAFAARAEAHVRDILDGRPAAQS